ncbi:MAG: beta-ketoacyl-[acyl-carrier-protein] synthase II [Calditrichaeota bacterium]|nr:MAG: beta-ketoacyl-[acyl-carrier-protein] synthase II [Calditrichota bacterium]MBL1203782.1 beta-ketoacyl-[acyl-carrier-protein] synthase II [Calditrichota bacterium]NOG43612.1 beta-ketoacyl-ACP synthase II [Calditrichota bacterium]
MSKKRVVITGFGAITPVGNTVKETWNSLLEGKSGTAKITRFDSSEFKTNIAAEVKNYDPLNFFDKKESRKLDRYTQFAIISADEALSMSNMDLEKEDRDRIGVIIGSGIGGMRSFEDEHSKLVHGGPRKVSPFFIPLMIADIAAGHVSMKHNLKGPNYATVSACATSGHSIGLGLRTIQYGDADVMVCGGAEASVTPMGVAGFNASKALSTRNDEPEKASRPFDKERDGFVIGEGAGTVVLEELEHARKRGATIYAELVGMGFTADAYHMTQPAPGGEGAIRAMKIAIQDAGLNINDIDYLNAHGTSTYFNDKLESEAIQSLFGDHAMKLSISSTKSMTGHLLGAAGAIEMIVASFAVLENKIPPTINYTVPDPECTLNYTPNKMIEKEVKVAISNSFGFGGHNTCLCVKKFDN